MSNMRFPPPGDSAWIPLAEAIELGMCVGLLEDRLNGIDGDDAPLYRTTPNAARAVLVTLRAQTLPGIQLEDGSVLVLSWDQLIAVQCAFVEFGRLTMPSQLAKFGMVRATMELKK